MLELAQARRGTRPRRGSRAPRARARRPCPSATSGSRACASRHPLRFGGRSAACKRAQRRDEPTQLFAARRQPVLTCGGRGVDDARVEDAGRLELCQSRGERAGRDRAERSRNSLNRSAPPCDGARSTETVQRRSRRSAARRTSSGDRLAAYDSACAVSQARVQARAPRRASSPGGTSSPRAPRRGRRPGRHGCAPG